MPLSQEELEAHVFDVFLNYPDLEDPPYPLDFQLIADLQQQDPTLIEALANEAQRFQQQEMQGVPLVMYQPQRSEQWKVYIPAALQQRVVHWYHMLLCHPGVQRLYATIATHFYFPHMMEFIEDYTTHCDICQRNKLSGRG